MTDDLVDLALREMLPPRTFKLGAGKKPLNFRSLIEAHLRETGSSVEEAVAEVFDALMAEARLGNVKAATVVLDRFFGKAAPAIDLGAGGMTLEALVAASMQLLDTKPVDARLLSSEPGEDA